MRDFTVLEYVWLDGGAVKNIRSKIKVVTPALSAVGVLGVPDLSDIPDWSFDGSSTEQADGENSDCILKPVRVYKNPFPHEVSSVEYYVLCEVMNPDGTPHPSNTRHAMMEVAERYADQEMWFAFEQEYTLYDRDGNRPYRWPEMSNTYPHPQGRYYCGVGSDVAYGREISEDHLRLTLEMRLPVCGTNAEVMPAQWEFQLGPKMAHQVADDLWMGRYILNRCAEEHNATIKLDPKPIEGDWNGAGCHINFSNIQMRNKLDDEMIAEVVEALEKSHDKHIEAYGADNHDRLTGQHETCSIDEFRAGHSDRGASIRIPPCVRLDGKGYLEDRRPAANIDPYEACRVLLETVCPVFDGAAVAAS